MLQSVEMIAPVQCGSSAREDLLTVPLSVTSLSNSVCFMILSICYSQLRWWLLSSMAVQLEKISSQYPSVLHRCLTVSTL